jgi:hypothetical protein
VAGRLTGITRARAAIIALVAIVDAQLGQTLLAGWRSPLVVAASLTSGAALAGIIQTPRPQQLLRLPAPRPARLGDRPRRRRRGHPDGAAHPGSRTPGTGYEHSRSRRLDVTSTAPTPDAVRSVRSARSSHPSASPSRPCQSSDHHAVIGPTTTPTRRRFRKQRLQPSPLFIGQIMTIEHLSGLLHPLTKIGRIRPRPNNQAAISRARIRQWLAAATGRQSAQHQRGADASAAPQRTRDRANRSARHATWPSAHRRRPPPSQPTLAVGSGPGIDKTTPKRRPGNRRCVRSICRLPIEHEARLPRRHAAKPAPGRSDATAQNQRNLRAAAHAGTADAHRADSALGIAARVAFGGRLVAA